MEDESIKNQERIDKAKSYNDDKICSYAFTTLQGYKIPYDLRRFETIIDQIERIYPCPKKILDLGCGGGIFLKTLTKERFDITGLDISTKLLKKINPEGLQLSLVNADAGVTLPFKNGSFNLILSFDIIEHIPDNKTTLTEISRILIRNGDVLVTVPNLLMYDSLEARFKLISKLISFINIFRHQPIELSVQDRSHIHKYTHNEWIEIFEQGELRVKKILPIFISPYIFERLKPLKKIEHSIYNRKFIFNIQERIEKTMREKWPFKHLGQSYLFILKKDN
jgi:2-polyprenyl-3-methyl-5-hydroxy-6-metoxy-1,4-benzoquinol methylase